jgi:hypothetical protein
MESAYVSPLILRTRQTVISRASIPPVALILAMTLTSLIWNAQIGIVWQPSLWIALPFEILFLSIAIGYSTFRRERAIAEGTFYLALWLLWPLVVTRLTYLGATLGYPLQDKALSSFDATMGFSWFHWARFVHAHPLLVILQAVAYESHPWQPVASIAIIACWGPPDRNGEFLTSVLFAAALTIALATVYPAVGPADALGAHSDQATVIHSLRTVHHPTLSYTPIVTFPSFHTVMAILFTLAHRGNRYTFPAFAALNAMMLLSIPYWGDHYLSDMLAGALVAMVSFAGARIAYSSNALKG